MSVITTLKSAKATMVFRRDLALVDSGRNLEARPGRKSQQLIWNKHKKSVNGLHLKQLRSCFQLPVFRGSFALTINLSLDVLDNPYKHASIHLWYAKSRACCAVWLCMLSVTNWTLICTALKENKCTESWNLLHIFEDIATTNKISTAYLISHKV